MSESTGKSEDLFAVVDRSHQIYAKNPTATQSTFSGTPSSDALQEPLRGTVRSIDNLNNLANRQSSLGALPGFDLQEQVERMPAQESGVRDLQVANAKMLWIEQELQNMNEELKNAKEEMQATTEELHTIDDELRYRNAELNQVNNDLTNRAQLEQVVWNLLTNAIKFTPKGGKVEVTLTTVQNYAQIRVSDTGTGIGAKLLPHIFDRFYQGDSSSSKTSHSLGVGLSIVRQIVELHGGNVRAESAGEGQGTTIVMQLPLEVV